MPDPKPTEEEFLAAREQSEGTEHGEDCTCPNCDPGRLGFRLTYGMPMNKAKVTSPLIAAGLSCLAFFPMAQAQGVRAVTFAPNSATSPGTWLSNNGAGILPPPGYFASWASWSCWVNSDQIPQNQERTLFASYLHGKAPQTVMQVSLDNTYQLDRGDGTFVPNGTHIKMMTNDGGSAGQVMTALSDTTIPTDRHWHHIQGGWDTSVWFPNRGLGQYALAATVDNVWMQWDPIYTGGAVNVSPQPFVTPYSDTGGTGLNNNWTHGAFQDPQTFTVSEYITSDLAECVFNNTKPSGTPRSIYAIEDENGKIVPLPLGPLGIFATGTIPTLYFHGNASAYPTNVQGGINAFTVNGTPLATAPDDPWTQP